MMAVDGMDGCGIILLILYYNISIYLCRGRERKEKERKEKEPVSINNQQLGVK